MVIEKDTGQFGPSKLGPYRLGPTNSAPEISKPVFCVYVGRGWGAGGGGRGGEEYHKFVVC